MYKYGWSYKRAKLEILIKNMSKKVREVPVILGTKGIIQPSSDEIKWMLRAADSLILSGGSTLLTKILKGSKDKKILELNLDKDPAYGYLKSLSNDEILAKIDWLLLKKYLDIRYDGRLPLLVYTAKGWEIEKDTYSDELLEGFNKMIEGGEFSMEYLKDKERGMILMLLDKVEKTGDPKYIPLLKAWQKIDYKKVQSRIRQVIDSIEESAF
jgi:superfamily II DNA helicase RecQ